jgi:uncharacterized membrane protein (DUF373 family)
MEQPVRPGELGRENGQAGRDHDHGRPRQHEHGDADGDDEAAHHGDDDPAELSQHRASDSSAAKLQVGGCMEALRKSARRERSSDEGEEVRGWIARIFGRIEDVVYVGLGVLLAGSALVLLFDGGLQFVRLFGAPDRLQPGVINLLDRILLILMIVEVMYTVQLSFREHSLVPEPFLIVGLVAATRRILVLTAEFAELMKQGPEAFRNAMIELALLTVMVLVLVASLLLLRRRTVQAERA